MTFLVFFLIAALVTFAAGRLVSRWHDRRQWRDWADAHLAAHFAEACPKCGGILVRAPAPSMGRRRVCINGCAR